MDLPSFFPCFNQERQVTDLMPTCQHHTKWMPMTDAFQYHVHSTTLNTALAAPTALAPK